MAESTVPPEPEQDAETIKQVLGYFVSNPQAADSLEGVARWRLLEEQVQRSLQRTESAVAWLVAQGYLDEVQIAGSAPIFKLNQARQADAVHLLRQSGRGGEQPSVHQDSQSR